MRVEKIKDLSETPIFPSPPLTFKSEGQQISGIVPPPPPLGKSSAAGATACQSSRSKRVLPSKPSKKEAVWSSISFWLSSDKSRRKQSLTAKSKTSGLLASKIYSNGGGGVGNGGGVGKDDDDIDFSRNVRASSGGDRDFDFRNQIGITHYSSAAKSGFSATGGGGITSQRNRQQQQQPTENLLCPCRPPNKSRSTISNPIGKTVIGSGNGGNKQRDEGHPIPYLIDKSGSSLPVVPTAPMGYDPVAMAANEQLSGPVGPTPGPVGPSMSQNAGGSGSAALGQQGFRVGKKIGSGSFGEIYMGQNLRTGEEVGIKLENVKRRNPHLLYECKLYKVLAGGVGIPNLHWYGVEGEHTVMVMDLLGPSLEDLFNYCGRIFKMKSTLMLAEQMIDRIEYVHSMGIIHRDIKPHNFLIGRRKTKTENTVFIIDFGLAKRYKEQRTGFHIPFRQGKSLTGTARYVSINTHMGMEQSRRDDLESLGYVFLYFLKGSLPWQGLKATSRKDKYDLIQERKHSTSLENLCKSCPVEFYVYMKYCRTLRFLDRPDYYYLKKLFRDLLIREGYQYDYFFDWTRLLQKGSANAPSTTNAPTNNPANGPANNPLAMKQSGTVVWDDGPNRRKESNTDHNAKEVDFTNHNNYISINDGNNANFNHSNGAVPTVTYTAQPEYGLSSPAHPTRHPTERAGNNPPIKTNTDGNGTSLTAASFDNHQTPFFSPIRNSTTAITHDDKILSPSPTG